MCSVDLSLDHSLFINKSLQCVWTQPFKPIIAAVTPQYRGSASDRNVSRVLSSSVLGEDDHLSLDKDPKSSSWPLSFFCNIALFFSQPGRL